MNKNLLGIDFEDWFHPELIKKYIKDEKLEPKVVDGIEKILELLRKNETYATFFVVGDLLELRPEILDKILENDHEIGFHTMHHTRLHDFSSKETFSDELKRFSKLTNNKSKGFRAPTFSLDSSLNLLASTDPAEPPPIITKSYELLLEVIIFLTLSSHQLKVLFALMTQPRMFDFAIQS